MLQILIIDECEMNFFKVLLLCVITSSFAYSSSFLKVEENFSVLNFITNQNESKTINIQNISQYDVLIDSIVFVNPQFDLQFKLSNVNTTISSNSIYTITLQDIFSKHNLTYKNTMLIYFTIPSMQTSLVELLRIDFKFDSPSDLNVITQNKIGLELKKSLSDYLQNHTYLTYKDARIEMFSDIQNVDGWVECVYTGRKIQTTGIPDVNTTHFNTEHTWPRSYGAEDPIPEADLYHIYGTDENANSKRGNQPFGYVVSGITYQEGGSKLGKDKNGALVFEPRDIHKGDVARSMFYFSLRYNNPYSFLTSQESVLREWMVLDPVSDREAYKGEKVFAIQKRYNPFIEYPELIYRIYSISTNDDFPIMQKVKVSTDNVAITDVFLDANKSEYIYPIFVTNTGNSVILIDSINFDNHKSSFIKTIMDFTNAKIIPVDSTVKIEVLLAESASPQQMNTLQIYFSNASKHEIDFYRTEYNSVEEIKKQVNTFYQNNILYLFGLNEEGCFNYEIIDLYGRNLEKGFIENKSQIKLKLRLSSSVYFIKLDTKTKSVIIPFQVIE